MTGIEDIPVFEGELEDKIRAIVDWVTEHVERRKWTNKEIESKFARRPAAEILEDGHTCYMNPCLDYTLVTSEVLKKQGYKTNIVVDVLNSKKYGTVTLHFAVEFSDGKNTHFISYVRREEVICGKGRYHNTNDEAESIKVIRFDNNQIGPHEHPRDQLDDKRLHQLFPGYDPARHAGRLKRHNTDRTYKRYLAAIGKLELIMQ